MNKLKETLIKFNFFSSNDIELILNSVFSYNFLFDKDNNLIIQLNSICLFDPELNRIKETFNKEFSGFKIEIIYNPKYSLNEVIKFILNRFQISYKIIEVIFNQELIIDKKNNLKLCFYDETDILEIKKTIEILSNNISYYINTNITISFEIINIPIIEQETESKTIEKIKNNSINNNSYYNKDSFVNKKINECLEEENLNVCVVGIVFFKEIVSIKNGAKINKLGIKDEDGAIYCSQYMASQRSNEYFESIKINDLVEIKAKTEINKFEFNEMNLKIISIIKKEKNKRQDLEVKKRVDFCLHSKMSSYDGMITPEGLKELLIDLNYKSFSITDRNSVQMFPEIEKSFKKTNIKPIYGAEFEVINKDIEFCLNYKDDKINTNPIVIFDLETNGLFGNFNEIIEFGAIKIDKNNNKIYEQFFIKPKKPISEFTTNLTGITNEMLEDGLDELTGIKRIIEFVEDSVLIAHNGINFDFKFLNTKIEQYGLKPLNNMMIDTLVLSRFVNDTMAFHNLEKLCKKYKITYDTESAHRADYDANVLYEVWINLVSQLNNLNILTYKELNKNIQINKERIYKSQWGYIVNIYAKNQEGLSDLYKLISTAHTKNYYTKPLLFWEDIDSLRKNLLVANNPIESLLINDLFTSTQDQIKKEIDKFDFILLPTISSFNHLISQDEIQRKDVVKSLNNLIELSKLKKKKIVCSPGAYYLNEDEEKYYYLFTKNYILNKKFHRFRKYNKNPLLYFRNTAELIEEVEEINPDIAYEVVVKNSNFIADQVEKVQIIKDELYAPKIDKSAEKLTNLVYSNAHEIYGENLPKIVEDQIKKELNSIISNKYEVVYWVSSLLVKKSIKDGYVVGSRGSVGSSLVATFSNITDVNPLPPHYLCNNCKFSDFNIDINKIDNGYDLEPKNCPNCNKKMYGEGHNIPFETFLGFKGDKVPDIDLNFSGEYQNKAHDFIKEIFGEEYAFRAGTISTIAEKSSFSHAREYFKLEDKKVNSAKIHEYSVYCIDVKRTTGQHPGGIIVIPNNMSIYDFTPVNYPADDVEQSWKTTHFAFEYIHDNLLKFDILGHDNPTILKLLKDFTNIDESEVPTFDKETMRLFYDVSVLNIKSEDFLNEKTGAVSLPEFGTKFVREMLNSAQPRTFSDLIRISGLSHGTDVWIGNAASLIKDGKSLKDVIACRDDIMIYLINKGIDPLISFKIMEDVRKGKQINKDYNQILIDNNVPDWYIESANKIKYMFPKAHATAYVLHAWKFAWFKLYYPLEYYCAFLTVRAKVFDVKASISSIEELKKIILDIKERMNSSKLSLTVTTKEKDLYSIYEVVLEAKLRGIKFKNIDINESDALNFKFNKTDNSILCPFISLDSLGDVVAQSIVSARNDKKFTSKNDLLERTKITKQIMKKLEELEVLKNFDKDDQITLANFIGD